MIVKFTMLQIFVVYRKTGFESTSQTLLNNWRHCLLMSEFGTHLFG